MTARSFLDILKSGKAGRVDPKRDQVLTGKERHVPAQENDLGGYPSRAIRTHEFLYIRNFKPDRWPCGYPAGYAEPIEIDISKPRITKFGYADTDGSPTKSYLVKHRDDLKVHRLFELAFGKRPAEELYDLRKDPTQLENVAEKAEYAETKMKLAAALIAELKATNDPRVLGGADVFDQYPYYGGGRPDKPPAQRTR